jgi:hypothetical protein
MTSLHGPHRKHHSTIAVQLLPWKHTSFEEPLLSNAVVQLLLSLSLPSSGSTCLNINSYCTAALFAVVA